MMAMMRVMVVWLALLLCTVVTFTLNHNSLSLEAVTRSELILA